MTEQSKDKDPEGSGAKDRNTKPIFIRRDIQPGQVEKRSRYCPHGYVWGRCPKGCS